MIIKDGMVFTIAVKIDFRFLLLQGDGWTHLPATIPRLVAWIGLGTQAQSMKLLLQSMAAGKAGNENEM